MAPVPLHEAKVTAWCAIASTFVLNPYFFGELPKIGVESFSFTNDRYNSMM